MLLHLFYGSSLLGQEWGPGGGGIVLHSVKALIISALLVLVAWLRWKANTGSPPLPSRTLSIEGGSVPGLNAGGPFSWKWLGHCGVSGALTIWRHIYKAFTCLTKAQTELRPKTPLFTCSFFCFFVFWNIPFKRPPSPQTNRHQTPISLFMQHHNSCVYVVAVAELFQYTWQK